MDIVNIIRFILILLSFISSIACFKNLTDPSLFIFSILSIIFYVVLYLITYINNQRIRPLLIYFNIISILWIGLRVTFLLFRYDGINYQYLASFSKLDVSYSLLLCILFTISLNIGLIIGGRLRIKFPTIQIPKFFDDNFKLTNILKLSSFILFFYLVFSLFKRLDNNYEYIFNIIIPSN